jgi:hypothetical protein
MSSTNFITGMTIRTYWAEIAATVTSVGTYYYKNKTVNAQSMWTGLKKGLAALVTTQLSSFRNAATTNSHIFDWSAQRWNL